MISLSTNSWVNAAATRKLNFVQEEVITTRVDRQNTTSGFVTIGKNSCFMVSLYMTF